MQINLKDRFSFNSLRMNEYIKYIYYRNSYYDLRYINNHRLINP